MRQLVIGALVAGLAVAAALGTAEGVTPTIRRTEVFAHQGVPNGQIVKIDASCPPGYVVTGGGLGVGANSLVYADTTNSSTFEVAVGNFSSLASAEGSADAFCIKGARNLRIRASLSAGDRARLVSEALRSHR